MDTEQHARILTAYVNRFTLTDCYQLHAAKTHCLAMQLNGNAEQQIATQDNLTKIVKDIISCMTEHDLSLIGDVVDHCTGTATGEVVTDVT